MPFDKNSLVWPCRQDHFFRDRQLLPLRQSGPHCVSTLLAILTGSTPEEFQGAVNTQDPISWSDNLKNWGMQLAYCPTDARKLKFYIPELLELDDLFTLSYYTGLDATTILKDPDERGWVCGSHIVILHRNLILDPAKGTVMNAYDHPCNGFHTKRIFRVVPAGHQRCL